MTINFLSFEDVKPTFKGKSVAVVGSGPGCLTNTPGFIDGHDVVVRVNNYKTGPAQGTRTDVHYSFYGTSIRKSVSELQKDGVKLCMCKCPNSRPIECEWHVHMHKLEGIDYRYIYAYRDPWWFCDTFIPEDDHYLRVFELLGRHIPTTGFSAVLDVLDCEPASVYMTGFDFFQSGVHNVNEPWRKGNPDDPICHSPDNEASWLRAHAREYPLSFDSVLTRLLHGGTFYE